MFIDFSRYLAGLIAFISKSGALSMAFPSLSYDDALSQANFPTLHHHRYDLCRSMFHTSHDPNQKLHTVYPPGRNTYNHSADYTYPLPTMCTDRFKDSLINYCIYNDF